MTEKDTKEPLVEVLRRVFGEDLARAYQDRPEVPLPDSGAGKVKGEYDPFSRK